MVLKHSCDVDKEIMNHKQEMIDRDDNLILHFTLKMNSFIQTTIDIKGFANQFMCLCE